MEYWGVEWLWRENEGTYEIGEKENVIGVERIDQCAHTHGWMKLNREWVGSIIIIIGARARDDNDKRRYIPLLWANPCSQTSPSFSILFLYFHPSSPLPSPNQWPYIDLYV